MFCNPVDALFMIHPEILNEIVGFEIETYYRKEKNGSNRQEYVFWEAGKGDTEDEKAGSFLAGKTKILTASNIEKRCMNKIREMRKASS